MLYKHIRQVYAEYVEEALPRRIEQNFYDSNARRQKGETILTYTSRKTPLFNQLATAGCPIPETVKGYILLRDAFLSAHAWDTLQTWCGNTYDYQTCVQALRRLERRVPGHGGKLLPSFNAFGDNDSVSYYGNERGGSAV